MKGPCTMRLSHLVSQYTLLENFSCLCRHHGITTPGAYTCLQHKYMQSRQRIYLRDVCEHIPHQLHPNREFPNDQSPYRGSSNPIEVPFQLPTARWANTDIPYVNLVSELTRPGWWHFSLLPVGLMARCSELVGWDQMLKRAGSSGRHSFSAKNRLFPTVTIPFLAPAVSSWWKTTREYLYEWRAPQHQGISTMQEITVTTRPSASSCFSITVSIGSPMQIMPSEITWRVHSTNWLMPS